MAHRRLSRGRTVVALDQRLGLLCKLRLQGADGHVPGVELGTERTEVGADRVKPFSVLGSPGAHDELVRCRVRIRFQGFSHCFDQGSIRWHNFGLVNWYTLVEPLVDHVTRIFEKRNNALSR